MLKQNNPGNIRPGQNYTGEIPSTNGFSAFKTMDYGIRAYFMNLHAAIVKHNRTCIQEYITAYAPPSENDTQRYIDEMCKGTGLIPSDTIPLDSDSLRLFARVQFTIEDEASVSGVSDADISYGMDLFVQDVPGWVQ